MLENHAAVLRTYALFGRYRRTRAAILAGRNGTLPPATVRRYPR